MPAAYSYDLRKKAMEALDERESIADVAKRFKFGRTALKDVRKLGDFQSRKPGSVGYNHKITDWDAFAEFAEEHGGKTQSDIKKEVRKSELNL